MSKLSYAKNFNLLAALATVAFAIPTMAKSIAADPSTSQIKWTGKKVTGQHEGTVNLKEGKFEVDGKQLKGGEFAIDMASIKDVDLKDTDSNNQLIKHLKSDDFFSVEKNPNATLKLTSIKPLAKPVAGNSHEVTAELTIKGITKPITFPALIEVNGDKVSAKATLAVDRTKYDIKFRSGKFFQNLGDKLISDEFIVDLDVHSKAAPEKVKKTKKVAKS